MAGDAALTRPERVRAGVVAAVALALGWILFWHVHGWVRTWGGDVLVVVFLVATLAAIGVGPAWVRLAGVSAISVGTEAFQGLGIVPADAHWLVHASVGATYDPLDLLAYALGLVVAAGFEWARWGAHSWGSMSGSK